MSPKKEKQEHLLEPAENKYLQVLTASRRARQLLDRAEKHGMAVDTEKVILQALNEFRGGKIAFELPEIEEEPTPKKKHK